MRFNKIKFHLWLKFNKFFWKAYNLWKVAFNQSLTLVLRCLSLLSEEFDSDLHEKGFYFNSFFFLCAVKWQTH